MAQATLLPEEAKKHADAASDPNPNAARQAPDWLAKGIVYQLWLRSFTPEGTLAAAEQRMADIASLGANIVYLSPVMLSDDDDRRDVGSRRACGRPGLLDARGVDPCRKREQRASHRYAQSHAAPSP